MLEHALLLDDCGQEIQHTGCTHSQNWDEVQEFCQNVYMPYRVQPTVSQSQPNATMLSTNAGRVKLTRFSYGAGIFLDQFDQDAGKILVLNTLNGALKHKSQDRDAVTTAGESFVVDCSRTDYWLEGDDRHMQLNLTIDHDVMEEIAERWFGFIPDNALWRMQTKFGGDNSRWLQLLDYSIRSINSGVEQASNEKLGQHLEELICVELLRQWASQAGIDLSKGATTASPYYVRCAEEIFSDEAKSMPTIASVASRIGVSARTLSAGFKRFRGVNPRTFLASRRLEGLRKDLLTAPDHLTIAYIASDWGYVNFGHMARNYKQRFGELPSQTQASAKHRSYNI